MDSSRDFSGHPSKIPVGIFPEIPTKLLSEFLQGFPQRLIQGFMQNSDIDFSQDFFRDSSKIFKRTTSNFPSRITSTFLRITSGFFMDFFRNTYRNSSQDSCIEASRNSFSDYFQVPWTLLGFLEISSKIILGTLFAIFFWCSSRYLFT